MDIRDSQLRTPLMTAMHAGNADVVSVFLKPKGSAASCLDRDREGRAAVHWTLHNSVRQYQCCSANRGKKENASKARSYRILIKFSQAVSSYIFVDVKWKNLIKENAQWAAKTHVAYLINVFSKKKISQARKSPKQSQYGKMSLASISFSTSKLRSFLTSK